MPFEILPEYAAKITWFKDSPDAGEPACICSFCGKLLGEEEVPTRLFNTDNNTEARFHVICFGTVTGHKIRRI